MAKTKQSKATGVLDVHAAIFISKYVRKDLCDEELVIVMNYFCTMCSSLSLNDEQLRTELESHLALSREAPLFIRG